MTESVQPKSLFWWSEDGLRLHARDYAAAEIPAHRPVIICLPGLTRNARDFESIAARFANRFRILCVDLRGRGDSAWAKDPLTYVPLSYVRDVERLIADQKLERLLFIGTSLGGIVTMLMSGLLGSRLTGAVLNDIGPEISPAGLKRIRGYVGKVGAFRSWMHCAQTVQEMNGHAFPRFELEDWLKMAKRLACLEPSGRIVFDYDPKIAEPFKLPGGEAGADMWPLFEILSKRPLLLIRGDLSDLLSPSVLQKMVQASGGMAVTVPHVGHAPVLDEPEAADALDHFLQRFL